MAFHQDTHCFHKVNLQEVNGVSSRYSLFSLSQSSGPEWRFIEICIVFIKSIFRTEVIPGGRV